MAYFVAMLLDKLRFGRCGTQMGAMPPRGIIGAASDGWIGSSAFPRATNATRASLQQCWLERKRYP